jgi:hypothetical protein
MDAARFDNMALLASEMAGAEMASEVVRDADKSAEVASTMLLGRLLIEG